MRHRIVDLSAVTIAALVLAGCASRDRANLAEAIASAQIELDRLEGVLARHDALREQRRDLENRVVETAWHRGAASGLSALDLGNPAHPLRPCLTVPPGDNVATMEAQWESMNACIQRGIQVEASLPRHEKDLSRLRERLAVLEALPPPPPDRVSTCSNLNDEEMRLLDWLWELKFPSSVDAVRTVVRGLGEPERASKGGPESRAITDVSFQGIPLVAHFSFYWGELVSHEVWMRPQDEETAARLHRIVETCLRERLGRVPEQIESNDPHEGNTRVLEWVLDGKSISLRRQEGGLNLVSWYATSAGR